MTCEACRGLSKREIEVVGLLAEGHRSKTVAAKLGVSPKTIYTHKVRIKRKLGLDTPVKWMAFVKAWPATDAPVKG